MPDLVGSCLTAPWSDQVSGDVAQLTTRGALLWRRADGVARYTDGLSVWSDDPAGPVAHGLADALSSPRTSTQDRRPTRDFRVDSITDEPDGARGDGRCATAAGRCTLRAAIMEANATPGLDQVTVPSGVYKLGLEGTGEDAAATGDLDITDDLHLIGAGTGETYLQGAGIDRVLDIHVGARVSVRDLRIRRGTVWNDDGAGIRNAGTLSLIDANVSSNKVFDGRGGGLFTTAGSATVLVRTSVWHNKATDQDGGQVGDGGGIYNQGSLWMLNATLANNEADGGAGGGLLNRALAIVSNSTVITNGAATGGGIESALGVAQIRNSIIAGSLQGGDCAGEIVSRGHNLIQHTDGCRLIGDTTGNITGRDPRLGELIEDGPRAGSQDLLPESPVIDAGTNDGCPPDDLRNSSRPRDGRGAGRATCDIGALEYQPT
jgi:CSLREA domain-containing protein